MLCVSSVIVRSMPCVRSIIVDKDHAETVKAVELSMSSSVSVCLKARRSEITLYKSVVATRSENDRAKFVTAVMK